MVGNEGHRRYEAHGDQQGTLRPRKWQTYKTQSMLRGLQHITRPLESYETHSVLRGLQRNKSTRPIACYDAQGVITLKSSQHAMSYTASLETHEKSRDLWQPDIQQPDLWAYSGLVPQKPDLSIWTDLGWPDLQCHIYKVSTIWPTADYEVYGQLSSSSSHPDSCEGIARKSLVFCILVFFYRRLQAKYVNSHVLIMQ